MVNWQKKWEAGVPPEKREKLLVFVRLNFGPVFIGFSFWYPKIKSLRVTFC